LGRYLVVGARSSLGSGDLPAVGTAQSEENPQNIAVGEEFAASVINAVINGPSWDRTVLLLTYDEHGGYYDHVPPPAAIPPDSMGPTLLPGENGFDGFARYGFRVPFGADIPLGTAARRVARGVRPHQHPGAGGDEVEPARADLPGRQRARDARHAGLPPAVLRRATRA
jgi:hypothetical protein